MMKTLLVASLILASTAASAFGPPKRGSIEDPIGRFRDVTVWAGGQQLEQHRDFSVWSDEIRILPWANNPGLRVELRRDGFPIASCTMKDFAEVVFKYSTTIRRGECVYVLKEK
jgi:hypothetical protein